MEGHILMSRTIGFIGGGNMAEGIIRGLISSGSVKADSIFVKEILAERQKYLAKKHNVNIVNDYSDLSNKADIIVMAVRPQDAESACKGIAENLDSRHIIVSICAGIRIDKLRSWIGNNVKIARIMPNTMIESGRGYSALAVEDDFSNQERSDVRVITDAIGRTMYLDENKFDAFTALSCAGPEWFILFAVALTDAGVEIGISREEARAIVYENMVATGSVLASTDKHPYQITDEMNTPGGIGIAGFHSFQNSGLHGSVMDAICAAYRRTTELG